MVQRARLNSTLAERFESPSVFPVSHYAHQGLPAVRYRVILSVLDTRKCEYLKDYSLDFEHARTLLLEKKNVDTCLPLSDILASSGQRLASGAMSRTAVSLCCAVVKETLNTACYLKIFLWAP